MNFNRNAVFLPLVFALLLVTGIFIGVKLNYKATVDPSFFSISPKFDKIDALINYIEREYVDTISYRVLQDKAIKSLLQDLDPHSQYIPSEELNAMNEPLQGNFEGIGIEFNLQKDTLVVVSPITGGPSEKTGLLAGDRIIKVDGESIAGVKISTLDITKKLKGKKGTKVTVTVSRRGKLKDYTITRGTIPINSVEVSYMVTDTIGYIKISRFAKTTHAEFIDHASKLGDKGMKKLILDLRNNGGGFLDAAVNLSDEFLTGKKLIVYTEGKARPRTSFYATKRGSYHDVELAILIDEGSASASEILAGAIQDNDRGTIIGRRSFGKGLVQEQTIWPDGSAIRLTIARYYTPTGRSIQKPYADNTEDYYHETDTRVSSGEIYGTDTLRRQDSLKYYTQQGKVVYGGGGIMPDIFIPLDTIGGSMFLNELIYQGLINQFAFNYTDDNREKLMRYKSFGNFNKNFKVSDQLFNELITFAKNNGIKDDFAGIKTSGNQIRSRLKALIAKQLWNNAGYYPVIHQTDKTFQKAVEVLTGNSPDQNQK